MKHVANTISGLFLVPVAAILVFSCGSPDRTEAGDPDPDIVINFDKSGEKRLLSFYFGGLISEDGSDPFVKSVIFEREGDYLLDTRRLELENEDLLNDLSPLLADGTIEWDEFEQFINSRYYGYRQFPGSVDRLMELVGDWSRTEEWFSLEVNGVMSPHRRRIHVPLEHLRNALTDYGENGGRLLYDSGTTFVSEHMDQGVRLETSVMRKRSDGFWDFFAYGENGFLVDEVVRSPNNLAIPSKCIGCHFGSRSFEPERSFPADAAPGPDGPRALYVDVNVGDADLVQMLDEHRRRSDTILGLYGTLFLSSLRAQRIADSISERDRAILTAMGF